MSNVPSLSHLTCCLSSGCFTARIVCWAKCNCYSRIVQTFTTDKLNYCWNLFRQSMIDCFS